ncbi:MAG: Gfo/Idh/MocA family oxidoreductase [Alphaproteobacteria bacterium]|nr:Gfo/Idh/MocA family oxidoreductase [Alphaproteobacteria bacterium]
MTELKVAFVGAGNMTREHMTAFAAQSGVVLCGVTNRTRAKAEVLAEEFNIPVVASDVGALYSETKADAVVMAVYEPAIRRTVSQILSHPWAALIEKPMGMNFEEAEAIAVEARARNARLFVGLNRRTIGATRAALEDLKGSDNSRYILVQDQQSLSAARQIGHVEDVVQNWMFANSVHLVDYINAFGRGKIVAVNVIEPWLGEETERVVAQIVFDSGDRALYEAIWNGPGPWSCTVTTQSRRWELRPLETAHYQNAGERSLNDVTIPAADKDYKPGFLLQAANFCAAVRGENNHGAIDYETALASMRLVHEIYRPTLEGVQ